MNSNQSVVPFVYEDSLVRTIKLENGEPGFFAVDVAKVLEHSDTNMMVKGLDDDEYLIQTLLVSGQNRNVIILLEPGLYTVLIRSNKPQAKPFRRWITHEVIPQIRKTGGYGKHKQLSELDARTKASKFYQNTISEGMKSGLSRQDAVLRAWSVTLEQSGYDFIDAIPEPFRSSETAGNMSGRSDRNRIKKLLESWYAVYGDKKVTVKDVLARINRDEKDLTEAEKNLRQALCAVSEKLSPWVTGSFISKHKGVAADSLYFEQAGSSRTRSSFWRVSVKI